MTRAESIGAAVLLLAWVLTAADLSPLRNPKSLNPV